MFLRDNVVLSYLICFGEYVFCLFCLIFCGLYGYICVYCKYCMDIFLFNFSKV